MSKPPKPEGWTEAEAVVMVCPMLGVNHIVNDPTGRCIGSECMLWRWMKGSTDHGFCGPGGVPS